MYYVFSKEDGAFQGQEGFVGPDRIHTSIKGGNYAVFSIEKGENYFDTAANAYQLAWYVFNVCMTELTEVRKSNPSCACYLGTVIKEETELPEEIKKIHIDGGKYMVFSLKKKEHEELSEVYRALYLMVYQVWAKRNRILLDNVTKISFFLYKDGILFCYLPIF